MKHPFFKVQQRKKERIRSAAVASILLILCFFTVSCFDNSDRERVRQAEERLRKVSEELDVERNEIELLRREVDQYREKADLTMVDKLSLEQQLDEAKLKIRSLTEEINALEEQYRRIGSMDLQSFEPLQQAPVHFDENNDLLIQQLRAERLMLEQELAQVAALRKEKFCTMKVFYGTDRNRTGSEKPSDYYGGKRGDGISWGVCKVSIPRDHKIGELEAPFSLFGWKIMENPEKHVVLLSVDGGPTQADKERFLEDLRVRIRDSEKKQAMVFVHGYNVSFEDAARRTAQIAYDLGFDGAPILYSWPSKGNLFEYTIDEGNVEWATSDLRKFLKTIAAESDANLIHLIAHSMGNRAVTDAAASILSEESDEIRSRFRNIILAAPDVDAAVFKRDIAPKMLAANTRITLYASSNDKALKASKTAHEYQRVGQSLPNLLIIDKMESIDASEVKTDFLGHSYFGDHESIITDMFHIFHRNENADLRTNTLIPVDSSAGRSWKIKILDETGSENSEGSEDPFGSGINTAPEPQEAGAETVDPF